VLRSITLAADIEVRSPTMNRHPYRSAVLASFLALAYASPASAQTKNDAQCIRGALFAELKHYQAEVESRRLPGQEVDARKVEEAIKPQWLFWVAGFDIRVNVARWFRTRNFKCLEQVFAELETAGATFVDGQSKLPAFLGGVREAVDAASGMTSAEIEDLMRDWLGLFPESILAQVSWVRMLNAAAWNARGEGFANTVTPNGARTFSRLNQEALARVDALAPRARDHLLGRYVTLRAIRESGIPRESLAKLSLEALRLFPNELGLPTYHAERLLPKWGGTTKDFEQFARQAREVVGEGQGDRLYASIYTQIAGLRSLHNFPEAQLDVVERGLVKLAETLDREHIVMLQDFGCRFQRESAVLHARRLWPKYAQQPRTYASANELDAVCREWLSSLPRT
jgi:hypothetical protein